MWSRKGKSRFRCDLVVGFALLLLVRSTETVADWPSVSLLPSAATAKAPVNPLSSPSLLFVWQSRTSIRWDSISSFSHSGGSGGVGEEVEAVAACTAHRATLSSQEDAVGQKRWQQQQQQRPTVAVQFSFSVAIVESNHPSSQSNRSNNGGQSSVVDESSTAVNESGSSSNETEHGELSHSTSDPCANGSYAERHTAIVVLIVIMVVSAIFEGIKHSSMHHVPQDFRCVTEALFGELTILGFVALILSLLSQTGSLTNLSVKLFHGNEQELLHLVELIHLFVFYTMLAYLAAVCGLVAFSMRQVREWQKFEKLSYATTEMAARHSGRSSRGHLSVWSRWLCRIGSLDYRLLRQEFICPVSVRPSSTRQHHPLRQDFDFAYYLSIRSGKLVTEIVKLKPLSWVLLVCLFVVLYGFAMIPGDWWQLWVLIGWLVLMVLTPAALLLKLSNMMRELIPPLAESPQPRPISTSTVGTTAKYQTSVSPVIPKITPPKAYGHQPLSLSSLMSGVREDHLHQDDRFWAPRIVQTAAPPAFLARAEAIENLPQATGLGGSIQKPNPHHLLYWGGKHGPRIYFYTLQIVCVSSALFLAVLALKANQFINQTCVSAGMQTLIMTLSLFFLLVVWALVYQCVQACTIIGSIELMRDHKAISAVETSMKLKASLQTLRFLHVTGVRIDVLTTNSAQGCRLSESEKVVARELFKRLDRQGKGKVDLDELSRLYQLLGYHIAKEALVEVFPDATAGVSFETFCTLLALPETRSSISNSVDIEQQARDIFHHIDKDRSGHVSAAEFHDVVITLNPALTMDDITMIVRELDKDGSGEISFEEFYTFFKRILQEGQDTEWSEWASMMSRAEPVLPVMSDIRVIDKFMSMTNVDTSGTGTGTGGTGGSGGDGSGGLTSSRVYTESALTSRSTASAMLTQRQRFREFYGSFRSSAQGLPPSYSGNAGSAMTMGQQRLGEDMANASRIMSRNALLSSPTSPPVRLPPQDYQVAIPEMLPIPFLNPDSTTILRNGITTTTTAPATATNNPTDAVTSSLPPISTLLANAQLPSLTPPSPPPLPPGMVNFETAAAPTGALNSTVEQSTHGIADSGKPPSPD